MKIIGAGLCRTGTMSTRKFLDDNGFGPCYHMQECILHGHRSIWESVFETQNDEQLKNLLENYNSGLDLPFIALFDETLAKNPDAKVILGVRDNPEVWVKSWRATVAKICELPFWTNICLLSEKPIRLLASFSFIFEFDFGIYQLLAICVSGTCNDFTITFGKL
jgi:hypothetical protein